MKDAKVLANIFKALCDETRVSIVVLLQSGEKCACHISDALNIAQSKLSYHMKILCESGIVRSWYVGKWTHYEINKEGSAQAVELLKSLTAIADTVEQSNCCNKEAV